jgi:hypothetical protein
MKQDKVPIWQVCREVIRIFLAWPFIYPCSLINIDAIKDYCSINYNWNLTGSWNWYHKQNLTLYSIYTDFNACATSVDPDQPAHLCHLFRIWTGHILVRNNLMNQKVNSVDPDHKAQMCHMIWIYTVRPHNKCVYME